MELINSLPIMERIKLNDLFKGVQTASSDMETVKGIYHIQHLNAYHSNLKNYIGQFKGISSKYLNNYLVWNNEVERRKNGFAEKAVAVLQQVASAIFEETCSALFLRPAVPLLVKNQS